MGMYDSVLVPCPECGTEQEFQSKSGECILGVYNLNNCPTDVLMDINRHSPYKCGNCGVSYQVNLQIIATPIIV